MRPSARAINPAPTTWARCSEAGGFAAIVNSGA
jgi:hypothetical protein